MKKIAVLGAGESGIGAALLAKKLKFQIWVSEFGKIKQSYKNELIKHNIHFEEGGHNFDKIADAEIIVKSPGIPDSAEIIRKLSKEKKKWISEIEFGARYFNGNILAITGSNGKTTTSLLCYHLMKNDFKKVELAGNIGESFCRKLAENTDADWFVLELSSFQLDNCYDFRANIAILLNITPDHLNRYDYDLSKYAKAKMKIFNNQQKTDLAIWNGNDTETKKYLNAFIRDQQLIEIKMQDNYTALETSSGESFDIIDFELKGTHNYFNACCAIEAVLAAGVDAKTIQKGLDSFQNVEHRLEKVAKINGVLYINDSKATNVDALFYALSAFEEPIVLIAGGLDKGNDYSQVHDLAKKKLKGLVCLGADNSKLMDYFSPFVPELYETDDIIDAVQRATKWAKPGDIVLLSPGCASFDLFDNYEDRGRKFKSAIWENLKIQA